MAVNQTTCHMAQVRGEKTSPECKALARGDSNGAPEITGYNANRERQAAFWRNNPIAKFLPGGGLAGLLAQYMQSQWQQQMINTANATNASSSPATASSNASRQSAALDSSGESWGAPTVGSRGGNASRGFSSGGW